MIAGSGRDAIIQVHVLCCFLARQLLPVSLRALTTRERERERKKNVFSRSFTGVGIGDKQHEGEGE